jgi:hypothetical protein
MRPAACLQADVQGLYCPRGCVTECWIEGVDGIDLGPREPDTLARQLLVLGHHLTVLGNQLWGYFKRWVTRAQG